MKKIILYSVLVGFLVFISTWGLERIQLSAHHFSVTFLDVGQGDATLIRFQNGQKMLVDCGPNKTILSRLGAILPFYDRTIEYVVATHPDLDHYGGCVDVLKRYQVKEVVVNGREKTNDPYWQEWDETIHHSGAVIKVLDTPEVWHISSSTLDFLSPDADLPLSVKADDSNNFSIVIKVTGDNGTTFLLTGDMEIPLEQALLKRHCSDRMTVTSTVDTVRCSRLSADVLKAGHHGSNTSSGEDFLRAVQASTAIISVGKKNTYGHPSLRVLKKLERAGAAIRRTDEEGDIVIE